MIVSFQQNKNRSKKDTGKKNSRLKIQLPPPREEEKKIAQRGNLVI